jgi:hypothetical protein
MDGNGIMLSFMVYTVVCLLKARTVESGKLPFLSNGSETNNGTTSVARQQIFNKQE